VQGIHKQSNIQVDIKIISKKDMLMQDIENLRDQISMYKTIVSKGVIRLFDYYESRDYMYLCLDKNNNISEKEILVL
jgi:serine/threonine protein kinase